MRPRALVIGMAVLGAGMGAAIYVLARGDDAVARGRAGYDAHCAACHGANLEGQPDWQIPGADGLYPAPPHDASGHSWHHSDADLIDYITLGGAKALAQMGVAFESGMPGFGDVLKPQDIEDILAYLKSRWPPQERAFQAERSGQRDP